MTSKFTWRKVNALGVAVSVVLWIVASFVGWISSIEFISHISMFTMVISFIAAWRADVPISKEEVES